MWSKFESCRALRHIENYPRKWQGIFQVVSSKKPACAMAVMTPFPKEERGYEERREWRERSEKEKHTSV
jgi:hypothetical protein